MGNYKSRPTNSCSEEHLKKINELHLHVAQKISSDLQLLEPSSLTDLQESCCRAEVLTRFSPPDIHHLPLQVERVAVFATAESVKEMTESGLSVVHLCCQSVEQETRHLRIVTQRGASLTERSNNEFYPLHLAAFTGDVEKELHLQILRKLHKQLSTFCNFLSSHPVSMSSKTLEVI